MSYLDIYKKRLNSEGGSLSDSFKNSTIDLINKTFQDSPTFKVVSIDGITTDCRIINDSDNSTNMTLLFRPSTIINRGSYADIDSQKWLIYDFFDKGITPKANLYLCNNIFELEGEPTKTLSGYDSMGRPIYNEVAGSKISLYCSVNTEITNMYPQFDEGVNLPDGRLVLFIPYNSSSKITEGTQFNMYDSTYKIIFVDKTRSDVVNQTGVIKMVAEKSV